MQVDSCYIDDYRYNNEVDKIFKALTDANRRKILTILKSGELNVNALLKYFDIGQATVSNHLSILKKAGLVKVKSENKMRIYSINWEIFNKFVEEMDKFSGIKQVMADEIIMRR